MSKLYIAYGSNLNKRQMRKRCPGAKSLGWFFLTNARLVFRGVADVEFAEGEKVPCGLWRINSQHERELDAYEGVSRGMYYKDENIVLNYQGKPTNALIYLMNSEGIYPPSEFYAGVIRQGYQDFKMDESFLNEAITRSFDKEPDEQTNERRLRQKEDPQQAKLVAVPPEAIEKRKEEVRNAYVGQHEDFRVVTDQGKFFYQDTRADANRAMVGPFDTSKEAHDAFYFDVGWEAEEEECL